jgi:hypothetical protein
MFSRLGQAAVIYNSVAIRPADTFDRYHIYDTGHINWSVGEGGNIWYDEGASGPYISTSSKHATHHHNLHGVELTYADNTTGNAMLNDLYFSFFTDVDYNGRGYSDSLYYTTDLAFRDKQL